MSSQNQSLDVRTGLYNKQMFFHTAEEILKEMEENVYCLVALDIEHFKLFNEWYGQSAGNEFLVHIGTYLKEITDRTGGIAGYLGEDDFCILMPCESENLHYLQEEIMGYVKQYGGSAGFLPAFGVFNIEDRSLPMIMMYDRAVIAMSTIKGNYAKRVGQYDEVMMRKMKESHVLLSEVQKGLERNEFTFYLQPKCNMATGRIIGLESLVRWNHPEKGLVSPGNFIPYLEESGFIVNLDMYIWNEVCRYLRKWLDEGKELLPISMNVSRIDIYTMDVPEYLKSLAEKYNIPLNLLEIEITESAFAEELQIIPQMAENMRNAGFTVLMDDFGSGYSSLNMLKDVNIDVLKIDMKFLDMNERSADKGLGILEAIIRMAKFMEMRMIAEGVETAEQVRLLVDMGCLYGQGYYFYRPLSIEVFENLLNEPDNFDYRGMDAVKMKSLGVRDFLNADMFSETLIHNILGGIGFYKVSGSNVELLQVNEYYYKVMKSNPIDLEEQRKHVQERIYNQDREEFMEIFAHAHTNKLDGGTGEVRKICNDGSIIWICLRAFFMKALEDGCLYYGAVSDVTEQKRREELLKSSKSTMIMEQKMNSILRQAKISSWEWNLESHTLILGNIQQNYQVTRDCLNIQGDQATIYNFPDSLLNLGLLDQAYENKLLKYFQNIAEGNQIEDRSFEIRLKLKDGTICWIRAAYEFVGNEEGIPVEAIGYYLDITKEKEENLQNQELIKTLEVFRNQSLYDFKVSLTRDRLCSSDCVEEWLEEIGCKSDMKFSNILERIFGKLILPSYRERFRIFTDKNRMLQAYKEGETTESLEYQRIYKGAKRWMCMTVNYVCFENGSDVFAYIFIKDIDREKRQELHLTKMAETDAMTGLYNRHAAKSKIEKYLQARNNEPGAVIMFDMDNFKCINDVFGHTYGDSVIRQNAEKLQGFFRADDVICRMGGDEFLVLCKNIKEDKIHEKLEKIIKEMAVIYETDEKNIKFSISAGYAMVPEQGTEFDELYRKADVALFTAKINGKKTFLKFDSAMKNIRYELAGRNLS